MKSLLILRNPLFHEDTSFVVFDRLGTFFLPKLIGRVFLKSLLLLLGPNHMRKDNSKFRFDEVFK